MYPTEYNIYDPTGLGVQYVSVELSDQKFVPQFNVNDYIGNRRITYIPTYGEFNQKDYSPYGNILWENNNNPERLSFLSKEKDAESFLGDFGVRKYDDLTGRFTAIDPLWEKYYILTLFF